MNDVQESDWLLTTRELASTADSVVGIAVRKTEERDQWHCGLVYAIRTSDQVEVRLLHLAWHNDLQEIPKLGRRYRWAKLPIHPLRVPALIAVLRRIGAQHPPHEITYAPSYHGARFGADGVLQLVPPGRGLTCATFVLAALRSHGVEIDLLDRKSWQPRTEDAEWVEKIVVQLRQNQKDGSIRITDEQIAAVLAEKGCLRYRPEEVTGACHPSVARPVRFADVAPMAEEVCQIVR